MAKKIYRIRLKGTSVSETINLNLDYQLSTNAKLYVEFHKLHANLATYFTSHSCYSVRLSEMGNSFNYDKTAGGASDIILRMTTTNAYHDTILSKNGGYPITNTNLLKSNINIRLTDETGALLTQLAGGENWILDILIVD